MDFAQVCMWMVAGICMFFVGRTLGYKECMEDLAERIAMNVKVMVEEMDHKEEESND